MQTVLVMGGTGFVGRALVAALLGDGYRIAVAGRDKAKVRQAFGDQVVFAPYVRGEIVWTAADPLDAIVNLAGVSLADGRWTPERKQLIWSSRMEATRAAVALIARVQGGVATLVNASAVGYYKASETATYTEASASQGEAFLARVCREWETEALKAQAFSTRVVQARFGVILGRGGGALTQMVLPYRLFAGGRLGSGRQWVSWVHMADVLGLLSLALTDGRVSGPLNVTAPTPVRMTDVGAAIGHTLHRPHLCPVPAFVLRTVLGEMATMVLDGQRVLPMVAETLGYSFVFQSLADALQDLLL